MFEWDWPKAAANRAKHGVSFDGPDLRHSGKDRRFLRLGRSAAGHVLMVAYTSRRRDDEESIRIISARRASRKERAAYGAAARSKD